MGKDKKQQKKKEKRETEKKDHADGNVNHNAETTDGVSNGEGCICPSGCLVCKEITCSDVVGVRAATASVKKFVKVFCSNTDCKEVPFMHESCYKKWEEQLIKQLRMRRITSDWNDEKVKRHLWLTDGGTYCFRSRKCKCGGFLGRVDPEDEELPKPTEKAEKNAVKAAAEPEGVTTKKQHLPALVQKKGPKWMTHDMAPVYSSNYYNDMWNRVRNRPDGQEYPEKPMRARGRRKGRSENAEEPEQRTQHRTTSFSLVGAMACASDGQRVEDEFFTHRRPDSASGTSFGGSAGMYAGLHYESENEDESDDDGGEKEGKALIGQIRQLLESVGGQLSVDDPLLTGIVANASGELMLAICDGGGLECWLSSDPQFDIDNGRARLRQNVSQASARLETSGVVVFITETHGVISCPSYDCTVFFDIGILDTQSLAKGDIVKFDATESKTLMNGHHWVASSITLLQRESQPLLTAFRRSCMDKGPAHGSQPKPVPVPVPTGQQKRGTSEFASAARARGDTSDSDEEWDSVVMETDKRNQNEPLWPIEVRVYGKPALESGEGSKQPEPLSDMVRHLTRNYMPTVDSAEESVYASTMEMLKSWQSRLGENGDA